jgi:hypothetical protein
MLEKTDLHNKTISAIASAEARKRDYEHNLKAIQNRTDRNTEKFVECISGTLDCVPEIHPEGIHNIHHEVAIILPPEIGKIYEGVIAYSVSSNVQPSSLYGPVNQSERKEDS